MSTISRERFDTEFVQWVSTYGSVTVQRIFDLFNFSLDYTKIKDILTQKDSIYYHFLRVPFVNIFNNIIINQADGYREYIQKIFIDYLLSGAANETNAPVQGESIREDLEENRKVFMALSEEFDIEFFNHNSLIAESQIALIKLAKSKFRNMSAVQDEDKQELLTLVQNFEDKGRELTIRFRNFRQQFRETIVVNQALLETLPNYHVNEKQLETYKESIDFDINIGEE